MDGNKSWWRAMVGTSSIADWPGVVFVSEIGRKPVCNNGKEGRQGKVGEESTFASLWRS